MGKPVGIDEDVLRAAERMAGEPNTTPGRVISQSPPPAMARQRSLDGLPVRDGFRYLFKRRGVVTPELVERFAENEL